MRERESKEGLCFCPGRRRHPYRESPYRNCARVKEASSLQGRFGVRKAKRRGVGSHQGIARGLRCVAVAEVDAYTAECVNLAVGCRRVNFTCGYPAGLSDARTGVVATRCSAGGTVEVWASITSISVGVSWRIKRDESSRPDWLREEVWSLSHQGPLTALIT